MEKKDFLTRLEEDGIICAEGYLFELERRGYIQAGPFVPTVVLDQPDAVLNLHREFARAGSDIIEAFTYYGHRSKLKSIGKEDILEPLNRQALRLAKQVAQEYNGLLAGNICNTNFYLADDQQTHREVRTMFEEQVGWAVEEGADLIIAETLDWEGEAQIALDVIKQTGLPAVITLSAHL